jgi:signal transduction histidine kinase
MERSFAFSSRLFLAFAVMALAFTASNAYVHTESLGIDAETRELADNALPSMERLYAASNAVHGIETAADEYVELPGEREAIHATIEARWAEIDRQIAAYRKLPAYPGEAELYEAGIPATLRALHATVARLYAVVEQGTPGPASEAAVREVRRSAAHAGDQLGELVKLNGAQARAHAQHIATVRLRTASLSLLLDVLALVIGAAAVLWVLRVFRARARLEAAHRALVEQRAAELEIFGTRVAHDLLSPLSALTYCLSKFKRAAEHEPSLQEALARARTCVSRARRMVDSILEFSRAGGRPAEGARAEVREIADRSPRRSARPTSGTARRSRSSPSCRSRWRAPPECSPACSPTSWATLPST